VDLRGDEEILARARRRLTRAEGRRERARERLAEARRLAEGARFRVLELEREIEELIGLYEENYPYGGPESVDEGDPEELRRALKERERVLKGLGEVNLGVLSEDRSLEDRIAFLTDQIDDCRGGIGELERLIADADRRAKELFEGALKEIDARFDALFRRLFGGGEAHLEIVPGDTLWTSGVDVMAYPPGKRPQGIAQLSGGERSLTGIAFLFAAVEAARSPLAILDEVDAALDEVNLRRFADLAREFAASRQIIVITHRRTTMERAELLYGITLSEPGLSQVVGVRLEDWS
jgi:chromosome segregation protein